MASGGHDTNFANVFVPNPQSRDTCEVFKPSYFDQPRPIQLTDGPESIGYGFEGGSFDAVVEHPSWASATAATKAVLMRPGSVTHHIDFEQRYIELEVVSESTTTGTIEHVLTVLGPNDPSIAPPGYYLLYFVVENSPTIGAVVRVG